MTNTLPTDLKITPELKEAALKLAGKKVAYQMIDEHVTPKLCEILKEMKAWTNADVAENIDEPVTHPDQTYLMSDEDAQAFFDAAHKLYHELGYNVEEGYCPVLMAQNEVIKAENEFIKLTVEAWNTSDAAPKIDDEYPFYGDMRKQWIQTWGGLIATAEK